MLTGVELQHWLRPVWRPTVNRILVVIRVHFDHCAGRGTYASTSYAMFAIHAYAILITCCITCLPVRWAAVFPILVRHIPLKIFAIMQQVSDEPNTLTET
jgi:hypothetical protein